MLAASAPSQPVAAKVRKKAVNITMDPALVAEARAAGINVSATCEAALRKQVEAQKAADWVAENREAIETYNAYFREHGLFGDSFRRW